MVCWDTSHTPPLFGGASPLISLPPHSVVSSLCTAILRDISIICGPFFPSVEGFGGVPPSGWEVWGAHQLFSCPYAHSGTFFVVHYVSHLTMAPTTTQLQWYLLACLPCHQWQWLHPWQGFQYAMVWFHTTLDAERLWRCSWLHCGATAANFIFNASSSLCQLFYGFSTGRFLFQSWASHHSVSDICLVSVLVSAFYFQVLSWMWYSPMGAQPLGFAPLQPFGVYPWQAYVQPGDGQRPTPGMHRVAAPTPTLGRVEPSATHSAVPQPIGEVYSLGGSIESPDPSTFPTWWGGVFFSRFGAIRWCSHIYPGFSGKVSSFTLFPRVWGLCLFGSGYCWLWTRLGLHPHWFTWDTRIGLPCRSWCHYIFSLFWISLLG